MTMHDCGEPHRRRGGMGPMGWKAARLMAVGMGAYAAAGRGERDGDGGRRDRGGSRGGWGGGWDERDHGQRRRGRGGRMFAGGELRLVLLKLIADQGRHGYELIKAIEELTGGAYAPSPGIVYPTLSLLGDEGLIVEAEGTGPRKAFVITPEGSTELDGKADEVEGLIARLSALGSDRERGDSPPVRRAVGNLFTALRQRAGGGGGLDKDTAHAIADILDDAARRIERL